MTVTAPPPLAYKLRRPSWDESEHPRDRQGRFIETGAHVSIWGGATGTVVRNLGNGRIEVARDSDSKHVIVHRNYLTVTARPDGSDPTDQEDPNVAALPEADAPEAADAEEINPEDQQAPAEPDPGTQVLVEAPAEGESREVNGQTVTVGDRVTAPSGRAGEVVGFTDAGGVILRDENGNDWPYKPDTALDVEPAGETPEQAPEAPQQPDTAAPETPGAPAQSAESAEPPEAPPLGEEITASSATQRLRAALRAGSVSVVTRDGERIDGTLTSVAGGLTIRTTDGERRIGARDVAAIHHRDAAADEAPTPDTPAEEAPPVPWGPGDMPFEQAQQSLDAVADDIADDNPALADILNRITRDPFTVLSSGRGLFVHREPHAVEGAPESNHRWRISAVGDGAIIGYAANRDAALRIAQRIEEAQDSEGRGFDFTQRPVPFASSPWRDTEGRRIITVVTDARAAVPAGETNPRDWETPVETHERVRPETPPPVEGSLDPRNITDDSDLAQRMVEVFSFTHPESGIEIPFRTSDVMMDPGEQLARIETDIRDSDGRAIGLATRTVFINRDNEVEVHHDLLEITRGYQGQGFADAYYDHLMAQYEARGVDVVSIEANIDVGGYAWAQRGFGWAHEDTRDDTHRKYAEALRRITDPAIRPWGAAGEREVAAREVLSPEQFQQIRDFATRIDNGERFSPKDLANALKDVTWTYQVPNGPEVTLWPGKHAMLGRSWNAEMRIRGRNRDEGGEAVPEVPPEETPEVPETPPEEVPEVPPEGEPGADDALQQLGELYRNDEGQEVWRIRDRNGNVVAEDVAGDSDAAWIAERTMRETPTTPATDNSAERIPVASLAVGDMVRHSSGGEFLNGRVTDIAPEPGMRGYTRVTVNTDGQEYPLTIPPGGTVARVSGPDPAEVRREWMAALGALVGSDGRWAKIRPTTAQDLRVGMSVATPPGYGEPREAEVTDINGDRFELTAVDDGAIYEVRAEDLAMTFRLPDRPGAVRLPDPTPDGPLHFDPEHGQSAMQVGANLKATFEFTDPETGWSTDFGTQLAPETFRDMRPPRRGGGITLRGDIKDADGNVIGRTQRTVSINSNGDVVVKHDLLKLRSRYQGQGFADRFYDHTMAQYRARGVAYVDVDADIDVGGYAWAQRGFDWHNGRMNSAFRRDFSARLNALTSGDVPGVEFTEADRDRIRGFAARLREEQFSPKDLANALKDLQWDHPADPRGNRTIRMWPGKYAMLGTAWGGRYTLNESVARVDTTPVDRLPDNTLAREYESLVSRVDEPAAFDRMQAILGELGSRYDARRDSLLGPGDRDFVEVGQMREGDRFVPPFDRFNLTAEPEVVTFLGHEPGEGTRVRYDDGTERTLNVPGQRQVYRAAPDEPVGENPTTWGKIRDGDRVLLPGLYGEGPTPVTVLSTRDNQAMLLYPTGEADTIAITGDTSVTRLRGPVPAPEAPPDPGTLTDEDLDTQIATLGRLLSATPITQQARTRARLDALTEERTRRATPPPELTPVEVRDQGDTPTARPALYTYQRRNLVALGLDLPATNAPDDVQQAAARVRARQPLTGDQAAALADHLRSIAAAPDTRVRQQRSLNRLAAAFDASAAAAAGRAAPEPETEGVRKVRTGGITEGDTIALPGGRRVVTGRVTEVRPMMGGRLAQVTLTHDDGATSTRLLQRDQDLFVLPDPPPARRDDIPDQEFVAPEALRVGDTVRTRTVVTDEERTIDAITETEYGIKVTYTDGRQQTLARMVLRTGRGDASLDQDPGIAVPADTPETVRARDTVVGDRVTLTQGGYAVTGIVTDVTRVVSERGASGVEITVLDEAGGGQQTRAIYRGNVTRLSHAGEAVAQQLAAATEARRQQGQRRSLGQQITNVQAQSYVSLADRAMLAIGHSREQVLRELEADQASFAVVRHGSAQATINATLRNLTGRAVGDPFIDDHTHAVIRAAQTDAYRRIRAAVEGAEPLPGETDLQAIRRVLDLYRTNPPTRRMDAVTTSLVSALQGLGGEGDAGVGSDPVPVDVPDGDLAARVAAYRRQAFGEGGVFGHDSVRRPAYTNLDLEALERGEAPEVTYTTRTVRNRARDGGPSETAMRHLDAVQAVGRELDDRIQERVQEMQAEMFRAAGLRLLPGEPPRRLATRAQDQAARMHYAISMVSPDLPKRQRDQRVAELTAQAKAADDLAQRARRLDADTRRAATLEVLGQIRDMGGHRLTYTEYGRERKDGKRTTAKEQADAYEAMKLAEASLPTDWVEAIEGHVRQRYRRDGIQVGVDRRGYASYDGGIMLSHGGIQISDGNDFADVAVHELTHFAERAVPGMREAEEAFLWSRTSTGPVGNRTREAVVNMRTNGGDETQWGYIDRFNLGYSGVDYAESARRGRGGEQEDYEIATMGMESLLAGSTYLDEDYRRFMVGMLAMLGNPRPPRAPEEDPDRPAIPVRTRGRQPGRSVTPKARVSGSEAMIRNYGDGASLNFASAPLEEQARIKGLFETTTGVGRFEVNGTTSSLFTDSAVINGSIVSPDGRSELGRWRVGLAYKRDGSIEMRTAITHPDRDEEVDPAVAAAYWAQVNTLVEDLGVTVMRGVHDMRGDSGSQMAAQGFDWDRGHPDSYMRRHMSNRLASLLEREDLSDVQKAELRRLRRQLAEVWAGNAPMPSPQELLEFMGDVRVADSDFYGNQRNWSVGEWLVNAGAWKGTRKTGIRKQTVRR